MGKRFRAWTILAALIAVPQPAPAHPHVHAEAMVVFVFAERKLSTIRLVWKLDRAVSVELLHRYDKDGDGKLTGSEGRALAGAAENEAAAFVDFRVAGAKTALAPIRDFTAAADRGRVIYRFSLPTAAPVDLARGEIALGLYDPAYYVDLTPLAEDAVRLEGDVPDGCRHAISTDTSTPLMGGRAYPRIVTLDCRAGNGA
jgi:ABC-type uncharacterized transport system substrate-binding protein